VELSRSAQASFAAWKKLRTRPSAVLAKDYDYDFDLAFRTFAQRCRWASAIRSRASLLRMRLALLLPFA
jgi:hypothetical protein